MTTIVMVHGAFCGGWTFERFRTPFEAAGYDVIAPDLRGHKPGDKRYAVIGVSMADYAADIARLCEELPEPPIVMGHSMGGLVAQLVARRVPVQALVLLAPSPPWGVHGHSIEETVTALGVHMMGSFSSGAEDADRSLMRIYTLDRVPEAEREAIIARLTRESGLAVRETLNWWMDPFMTTSVGTLEIPALVINGERDVVNSVSTARAVARKIGADFRAMPAMSHWLVGEPGWDAVAAVALQWLAEENRAVA